MGSSCTLIMLVNVVKLINILNDLLSLKIPRNSLKDEQDRSLNRSTDRAIYGIITQSPHW